MWEVRAPAVRGPVRTGSRWSAAALLGVLIAAGCRPDAPPQMGRVAEAGEALTISGSAASPVNVACELAAWVVDDALGLEVERSGAPLSDLLSDAGLDGCRLTATGSFAELPEDVETPIDLLWDSFEEGGWHEDVRYASDTEETSAVGMWKSGVLCLMGAVWAPGEYEEYDGEYEPTEEELRYDVMVECVQAEAPPIPLLGSVS